MAAGRDAGAAEARDGREKGDRDGDEAAAEALEAHRLPALLPGDLGQVPDHAFLQMPVAEQYGSDLTVKVLVIKQGHDRQP